jgi:hypothetical protein
MATLLIIAAGFLLFVVLAAACRVFCFVAELDARWQARWQAKRARLMAARDCGKQPLPMSPPGH